MAKKRRAFPGDDPVRTRNRNEIAASETIISDQASAGLYGFLRDFAVRETVESIVIAIMLAMMFKAFQAEAFIIPTGSMAPSLQGQHIDLECEQCQYRYRVGSSGEASSGDNMIATHCPICQYRTDLDRRNKPDHVSNNGDRILVNKFIYDFGEPERFDVIVFKYPNQAKQNYIKRLIGLPGDNLLIENGDIFLMDGDDDKGWTRRIARKPAAKIRQTLIEVDDTDFIGHDLTGRLVQWPYRWNQYRGTTNWRADDSSGKVEWKAEPSEDPAWLQYRNIGPLPSMWSMIKSGVLPSGLDGPPETLPPGRLISDYMAYNDGVYKRSGGRSEGLHWVGDVGLEAEFSLGAGAGELLLDTVEGGAHFICRIDASTGNATLECSSDEVTFVNASGQTVAAPTATTSIRSGGEHSVLYVNADDEIRLWVDGSLVEFDAATFERTNMPIPKYDADGDAGDAEPVGIGVSGIGANVKRLKVVRDLYYSSANRRDLEFQNIGNETNLSPAFIKRIFNDPASWAGDDAQMLFKAKKNQTEPMFRLAFGETRDQDQFMPMGDNSTESLDARIWPGNNYFERDMLIGRALIIYWPHTLNKPVPYFPNFGRMGFIR